MAWLQPDKLCVLRALNQTHTPVTLSPSITIQLIEDTYCHNYYPKHPLRSIDKYPKTHGWNVNPLITIIVEV